MASARRPNSKAVRKVILWTAPRCISTAFERAIMNLDHGKIFHEPFSLVYYFGAKRKSRRYPNYSVQEKANYEEIMKDLTTEYEGKNFVFSKDMAYYLNGNYEILLQSGMDEYKHSFLIRSPQKAVPSLYRASVNTKKTGWDYFDPDEVGFRELLELYEFVVNKLDNSPVVIDADDLLEAPEAMMRKYCEATGLVYKENMTSWQAGVPVPEWDVWAGWHDAVLKSTGLMQKKAKPAKPLKLQKEASFEIEEVVSSVNDSMTPYDILFERRLKLTPNIEGN